MDLPRCALLRQNFPRRALPDPAAAVRETMQHAPGLGHLPAGASIAVGVGSRGIASIDTIVRALVDSLKARGWRPFLFPAMGSHGAATAKGQAEVLAKFGLTEQRMGCPVRSSLSVVPLGRTPEGIDVVADRLAFRADAVLLVSRVKWHTDFAGRLESGLFKMMAIGLGKYAGAQIYHAHGHRLGLETVIRSVGRHVLASGKVAGGLAILEDPWHEVAHVEFVPAPTMEKREEDLLELVKSWMPRLPVDEVDLLLVDEIGKNWSGSGMDPKIINRDIHGNVNPWPFAPRVGRVIARGLHPLSYGNAIGIGMADAVLARLVRAMKRRPTYVNGLTSGALACLKIPATFRSDRECLSALARTTGKIHGHDLGIAWIRNTQDLTVLALSENLLGQALRLPHVELLSPPRPLEFDGSGHLLDWLRLPPT
ncbi:MAG: lactate racemase domain-containing protein [Bryobacteraceae bacterium]|nr:lactate racemase domain-containing protein [Bryobacteraceae bacterium]